MSNRVCKKCDGTGSLLVEYLGAERWAICDCTKQTLFEAAKDAPDGTRFKVGRIGLTVTKHGNDCWDLRNQHGNAIPWSYHTRTDFEIIPPGPRKRDTHTPENEAKRDAAYELINQLSLWEGAHVGNPVLIAGESSVALVIKYDTYDQCHAAVKSECGEHIMLKEVDVK